MAGLYKFLALLASPCSYRVLTTRSLAVSSSCRVLAPRSLAVSSSCRVLASRSLAVSFLVSGSSVPLAGCSILSSNLLITFSNFMWPMGSRTCRSNRGLHVDNILNYIKFVFNYVKFVFNHVCAFFSYLFVNGFF